MAATREKRSNAGSKMARLLDDEDEDEFYKTTYGGFSEVTVKIISSHLHLKKIGPCPLKSFPSSLYWPACIVLKGIKMHLNGRVATAQGKQDMAYIIPCQGKHKELGHFAKTQGFVVL